MAQCSRTGSDRPCREGASLCPLRRRSARSIQQRCPGGNEIVFAPRFHLPYPLRVWSRHRNLLLKPSRRARPTRSHQRRAASWVRFRIDRDPTVSTRGHESWSRRSARADASSPQEQPRRRALTVASPHLAIVLPAWDSQQHSRRSSRAALPMRAMSSSRTHSPAAPIGGSEPSCGDCRLKGDPRWCGGGSRASRRGAEDARCPAVRLGLLWQ
jgi:hypothetical protein